jgi:hypothetical protein
MRIIQFQSPAGGRRVGVVKDNAVHDVTAARPELRYVVDCFAAAQAAGQSLAEFLTPLAASAAAERLAYDPLWAGRDSRSEPTLCPPLDHPDPHRVLVAGTGLTHLGSMQSRDQMHAALAAGTADDEARKSDSRKMFERGLRGGRPAAGERGDAPEWFYKGNGANLRGAGQTLALPAFALDGGEEPELVGCYVIDPAGVPRRLGFALGNEWSDHATEKINYLYLAPSKLRECAVGPELVTDCDFQHIELRCTVCREGRTIYDSGPLLSGERHMSHTLANLEDHHFKYPQHRLAGDVHIHYFGTSKLSYGARDWRYQPGDEIRIEAPGFSGPLVNTLRAGDPAEGRPVRVMAG